MVFDTASLVPKVTSALGTGGMIIWYVILGIIVLGMLASRIFKALRVTESLNGGEKKSKVDFLKFW